MKKDWDYGTLGCLIKDIDGNGIEELIFGENAEIISAEQSGAIIEKYVYEHIAFIPFAENH